MAASVRTDGSDHLPSATCVPKTFLVVCLLLAAAYAGVVAKHDAADERLSQLYLEQQIESEYPPGVVRAMATPQETTAYQHVIRYDRAWTGAGPNPHFNGRTRRCLRLGVTAQLCESWANNYHEGLVDVPMSPADPGSDVKVLVAGGDDWIAVDHLREYGVTVDHAGLDGEFMHDARTDPFFARWHDDAYEYNWLNTTVVDGYRYLQKTDETYDLVLLDILGATDDDLLTFYSTEFYRSIRTHLSEDGVAMTWGYSPDAYPEHHKAFIDTVGAAGFTRELSYWVREGLDDGGETEYVEQFYALVPGGRPRLTGDGATRYIRVREEHYDVVEWYAVPYYRGIRENSISHPNYDILVDT